MGDSAGLRIATRGSDLALRQAMLVAGPLRRRGIGAELVIVRSRGDVEPDRPLREVSDVGFFTKELEEALLDGRADVAVHSYKDLPTMEAPGLIIAAVPERAAPNDWLLIHREHHDLGAPHWPLRVGARVGTCSTRRSAQLLHRRPDLHMADLRGNVPTRVGRLRSGEFDAIVLAQAGLERLGLDLSDLAIVDLLVTGVLPAPAQGALAVQCRADDARTLQLLAPLHERPSGLAVAAERGLLSRFDGGCSLAMGCLAETTGDQIRLRAVWIDAGALRECIVRADSPERAADFAYEGLRRP